jgi:Domain of Unknown Function (DUF1080)
MRSTVSALLGCACVAFTALPATAADPVWKPLFNGQDLKGWTQHGGKATYAVEGNEIVGRAVPGTPNSFICTERSYTNFVLELDFKPHPALNSGVQVRSEVHTSPRKVVWNGKTNSIPAGRVHGYQIEIDPSKRAWTGGIYDEGRRGWMADLKTNEPARAALRMGEWNQFRIECVGDQLKTFLNGVPAAQLRDSMTPSGFIALQVHGVGKNTNQLELRWRNVRIQELP